MKRLIISCLQQDSARKKKKKRRQPKWRVVNPEIHILTDMGHMADKAFHISGVPTGLFYSAVGIVIHMKKQIRSLTS